MAHHAARGPLAGVRVIELATVLMAPLASQILGDMGADVIKVESEKLDSGRVLGGMVDADISSVSLNLQRNKRSIRLDLKNEAGREVLLRVLDTADVFITNMRPQALARLSLDALSVTATRPQLIYCEAHGFRNGTPDADRPAFDDIIQAESGMTRMGERAGMEVRFLPAVMADKLSGLYVAQAVLGALLHHRATGRGQHVEVPMFDAVLHFNLIEHLAGATIPGGSTGYSRILSRHRGPHATKDGYKLQAGQTLTRKMFFGNGYGAFRRTLAQKKRMKMFLATVTGDEQGHTSTARKAITVTAAKGLR